MMVSDIGDNLMPTTAEIAETMVASFVPEKAQGVDVIIQFDLSGDNGGQFWLDIKDGQIASYEGVNENPKMTLKANAEDWYNVATGKLNAMQAFMSGKIKIQGDMSVAMKLNSMFSTSH
jgi:putative sterol carrier protein